MRKTVTGVLAALAVAGFAGSALADGDAAAGEKVFKKCKTCHQVGPDAKNRVGPELNAIVGRTAGAAEGFKYSSAMMAKNGEGFVWTEENIDAYLADPKGFVPGNKMTFGGLKKEDDRENVIAYLKTFQ
jgi:cytochrome c2